MFILVFISYVENKMFVLFLFLAQIWEKQNFLLFLIDYQQMSFLFSLFYQSNKYYLSGKGIKSV